MNIFKRAAQAIGRRFKKRNQEQQDATIESSLDTPITTAEEPSLEEAIDKVSSELLALDPDRVEASAAGTEQITGDEVTASARSETPWSEDALLATVSANDSRTEPQQQPEPEPITYSAEPAKMVEAVFSPAPAGPAVEDLSSLDLDQVRPVIEKKPEPAPKPSVSFTQLFELISGQVNHRADKSVDVYERLLAATREELEAARKSNKLAWSVGGVMTAFAAIGGMWSATQIGATRVEVSALKQQVASAQQASLDRERFTAELMKISQVSAKVELDGLRARLDQAIAVTAERDRLRNELTVAKTELAAAQAQVQIQKVVSTPAATQPVSAAPAPKLSERPLAVAEKVDRTSTAVMAGHAVGSERPDVWSMLLNGRD
jgi:hypothetical protein